MTTFAKDRHSPVGEWVQSSHLEKVAGVQFRKEAAAKFAKGALKAERAKLHYGLELRPDPANQYDRNAIEVHGVFEKKGWFSKGTAREHIGFVPKQAAQLINDQLISKGLPIAAELYGIYVGDGGFIDIEFFVLGPPGHSVGVLERRSREGVSTKPKKTAKDISEDDIAALQSLSALMQETPVLSQAEIEKLYRNMTPPDGDVLGGSPETDNDLARQTKEVRDQFELYLKTGQTPAPYYAYRIAVIARKAGLKDQERDFLAAWCKHFSNGNGRRYQELVDRAKKLGAP